MKIRIEIIALLLVGMASLPLAAQPMEVAGAQKETEQTSHQGIGKVVSVDHAKLRIKLAHEPIKSLGWSRMLMDFIVAKASLLDGLKRVKLRDVLRYNQQSVLAYLFKEYFQQFWDYDSPAWAGKFLDQWCTEVMRSRIEPLKKFVRTVRNHRELLLNYFRARKAFSSGIVEGLNNKAKVTMRKAYGFRTFKMLELALYHVLGKLPEPKLTHSFY